MYDVCDKQTPWCGRACFNRKAGRKYRQLNERSKALKQLRAHPETDLAELPALGELTLPTGVERAEAVAQA